MKLNPQRRGRKLATRSEPRELLLYRYMKPAAALATLQTRSLKASKLREFNDPFELMFKMDKTMSASEALQLSLRRLDDSPDFYMRILSYVESAWDLSANQQRDALRSYLVRQVPANFHKLPDIRQFTINERFDLADRELRVICFSSNEATSEDEILMWSHYTDHHQGVRIGFKFPTDLPHQLEAVDYRNERQEYPLPLFESEEVLVDALTLSIFRKSKSWAYENEYRMLIDILNCEKRKGLNDGQIDVIPVDKEWIYCVDLGARIGPDNHGRFIELLKKDYSGVQVTQADYNRSRFALDYHPVG